MTTPGLGADALLAGPRGRRLCLELAEEFDAEVRPTAFFAARSTSDGVLRQNLVDALARTGAHAIDSWTDPLKFAEAVDHTVSSAMYWQPPDNWDVVLADAEVTETLRRIAEAVVAAPAAAWWSTPVELSALRYTDRHNTPPLAPQLAGAAERLRRWHERIVVDNRNAAANRPADPAASLTRQLVVHTYARPSAHDHPAAARDRFPHPALGGGQRGRGRRDGLAAGDEP
jgi:hypothetical protein